jgi:hypothetical protein
MLVIYFVPISNFQQYIIILNLKKIGWQELLYR